MTQPNEAPASLMERSGPNRAGPVSWSWPAGRP
jgi:hypothetical protein